MFKLQSRDLLVCCALMSGACGRLGVDLLSDGGEGITPLGDAALEDAGADGTLPLEMRACMVDSDGDGTFDCDDGCRNDPAKTAPGVCGCMVADSDRDQDGMLDCVDTCGGSNDAAYVANASCGVGYCRTTNQPSRCVGGVETLCRPGTALASDATCDGVDDDCDGVADEDYVPVTGCGVGYCAANATPSSCALGAVTACAPAAPLRSNDPTKDGIDDDCDGTIDEDACVAHSETFGAGSYTRSAGTCGHITVKLWGGGGASGNGAAGYYGLGITGGTGGAGGFAKQTFTVTASSSIALHVGQGAQGCGSSVGTNPIATYRGGNGATSIGGNGTAGSDGSVTGGAGANPSSGGRGGAGSFGGGGGGAGASPGFSPFGEAGAGGAASVAIVDGTRLVAGGGGGGGGAGSNLSAAGFPGGNGGSGCAGAGAMSTSEGGGGGGGGVCQGAANAQRGTGRMPYDAANELPNTAATGGNNNADCQVGGPGYAVVTYNP